MSNQETYRYRCSECSSEWNWLDRSKMMPRLPIRKCVVLGLLVVTVVLLYMVMDLFKDDAFDYERGVPAVDKELWDLLGEREEKTTSKIIPQTTTFKPQVHVKRLDKDRFGDLHMNMTAAYMERIFFGFLENKDVKCDKDMRLGSMHDGGWNVCMSPPYILGDPCIIFSFGIGYDWQFDDSVSKIYGCKVLAFDPSMKEPDDRLSPLIEFKAIGIGGKDEVTKDGWHLKTLGQHLKDEGYWGVPVDYVKIDVEYTEWAVLKTAFMDDSLKYVKQLAFEMHTRRLNHPGPQTADEDKLEMVHMYETLRQVEIQGFKKFNYRKNPFGNYYSNYTRKERSCCYDLHYVNTHFVNENTTILHTQDAKIFH